jgi:hypothetical protein
MGRCKACPLQPGTRYVGGELDDPDGKDLAEVHPIRDQIERQVRGPMADLNVDRSPHSRRSA